MRGVLGRSGCGCGGYFCSHGGVWAVTVIAIDAMDVVVVINGHGVWGCLIGELTQMVEVGCIPSEALGATRDGKKT